MNVQHSVPPSARAIDPASAGVAGAQTHCPYCALQCGMTLSQGGDGALTVSPRDFPTNRGGLCRKGWTAAALLGSPERLLTPLLRESKGAPFREASWDEALGRVAERLLDVRARHGADAVAVFGGGGLTNEKAYLLGKFARLALGTANIDYNGRYCMSSAAAAGARAYGLDRGLPFPIADIAEAEVVLIAGSNPAETMPPLMQYFDGQRERGGRLIVVDPRLTATAKRAALHLQNTPGTDGALATGLLHVAIRDRLIDRDFIEARTSGFETVRRIAAQHWPDRVERITGVPERTIVEAAHLLGEAATAMVLTGRGPEQQSQGVDNATAFINLALALGKAGRPHCGWGTLTGQGNGQGGREHGQKADQLPGYRKIADPLHRAEVAAVWGVDPGSLPGPGLSADELLDAAGPGGAVKAMMVLASNVAVSAPAARRARANLAGLEFLVVSDIFLSETAALADVVLPTAQWAEEEGTMTNLEGRVIRRRRALPPPAGVRTDAEVLSALAARFGSAAAFPSAAEPGFAELRRASRGGLADYSGITYARIEAEDGVFWPCPEPDHPGTPRLFLDRFAHPDGRARFFAVEHRPPAEVPDRDYPYWLTTGRVLAQYQSGSQTRRVPELAAAEPSAFVEIHPQTARGLGLKDGDRARLTTRRGSIAVPARLTPTIRLDTLFVPFHWGGEQSANLLTNAALDPTSRMPEFKVCAVRVERDAA